MMNKNYQSITSWKDVCKYHGIGPVQRLILSAVPDFLRPFTFSTIRLALIVKAINGDFVPDWDDAKQEKWWGLFWLNKPGFRLYYCYYDHTRSYTTGGSRLCCETRDQFMHIVKYFLKDLEAFYTS